MEKKHNGRINKNRIKKKETTKKKEHNERLIKNGTMRYQILLEQGEKDKCYYEPN